MEAIATKQDKSAFVTLYQACAPRLKAFAMQSGSSSPEAEELVQECMLTVWRKARSFNAQSGAVTTWLYTIVRNKRIDKLRKEPFNSIGSDDLWPEEHSDSLENRISSDLEAASVRTMINTLPEEQRQIVFKVYFEGKSHSEIAGDLDLPLGTIKSRLRLAMNKLDTLAKEHITWLIIILLTNY